MHLVEMGTTRWEMGDTLKPSNSSSRSQSSQSSTIISLGEEGSDGARTSGDEALTGM
jgi:hypothetical protein